MIIYLKGIAKKENEWCPQQSIQSFFCEKDLIKIIEEEKLKENMMCVREVILSPQTQVLSNVELPCNKYNNEFIFLVKNNKIIKGRDYHWAYVTNVSQNTEARVILELTIDTLSSNLDLFNTNKFAGEVYTERTNNRLRCVNDIHSDVCSGIENKENEIIEGNKEAIINFDTFIENKTFTEQKVATVGSAKGYSNFITRKGVIYVDGKFDIKTFFANSTLTNMNYFLPKNTNDRLPDLINVTLAKHNSKSSYGDDKWLFPTENDVANFLNEIRDNSICSGTNPEDNCSVDNPKPNYILSLIDKIITDKNVNSWLSAPKIFDVGDSIFEEFTLNTNFKDKNDKLILNFNLKNHMDLHKKYFIIFNDLIKIPIDILQLQDNLIYGTRIINSSEVIFNFYYLKERIEPFYTLRLTISNGQTDDKYIEYLRQLDIANKSGQTGIGAMLPDIIKQSLLLIGGTIGGVVLGKLTAGVAIGAMVGWLANTALGVSFDKYKEEKQNEYELRKILSQPQTSSNSPLNEALYKVLISGVYALEWCTMNRDVDGKMGVVQGYIGLNQQSINKSNNSKFFNIYIEKPILCDIDKIELDQKQYGNILSEFLVNNEEYQNPLIINNIIPQNIKHLYWKGKVNPKTNPIDNFQLDTLNETLARGVKIYKCQKDKDKDKDKDKEKIIAKINEFINRIKNMNKEIEGNTLEEVSNNILKRIKEEFKND